MLTLEMSTFCKKNMKTNRFRVCSFVWIDLRKTVKMNLCRIEWMNMCGLLVDLEGKVSGFGDKFYES